MKDLFYFIKIAMGIILIILFLDFICFAMWQMSGQTPTGDMYFGKITNTILTKGL